MTTGGRRPRTGLGWEWVRRHRSSKAARPDNGPESPHRRRTFAVAVAASSSSAGRPACPDRCRQPVGVRGVNDGELFPGSMARDVFDLDCGQAGGRRCSCIPGQAIESDLLAREPAVPWIDVAGMRNHSLTATSIPPMESCKPHPPRTYQPSWPAAKRLLDHLAVDPRHDRRCIRSSGSRHRRGRCPGVSGPAVTARNDRRLHSAFIVGGRWPAPKGLRCQRCTSARSCGSLS